MPTIAAQDALTSMWPILYAAQTRLLNSSEVAELRRLCNIVQHGIPGRPNYTERAEQLCLSLHSSGVFETGKLKGCERILEYIDDMRKMAG